MNPIRLFVPYIVFSASAAGVFAGGTQYTLINIADSTGPISTTFEKPCLNDAGVVGFWCAMDDSSRAILTGSGGPLTTVATGGSGQNFTNLNRACSINASNTVVFHATTSQGHGIYAGNGGPVYAIATPLQYSNPNEYPSINDSGVAAFVATPNATFSRGVHIGNGGEPVPLYHVQQGTFLSFGETRINDAGVVAFVASTSSGILGLYKGSGGPATTIADNTGMLQAFGLTHDMNNAGVAIFAASLDAGGVNIYTADGSSPPLVIATSTGPMNFTLGDNGPCINDSGDVAFLAQLDAGGHGIYTGPDLVNDKVIKTGDSLFGGTVGQLGLARDGLNTHGDIAFRYGLTNGVWGIAVAKSPQKKVPGDVTGDGSVNVDDLLAVINAWGVCAQPCPPACPADVNDDCSVNVDDLLLVINNWG